MCPLAIARVDSSKTVHHIPTATPALSTASAATPPPRSTAAAAAAVAAVAAAAALHTQALNFFSFDVYSKALAGVMGDGNNSARFLAGAMAGVCEL